MIPVRHSRQTRSVRACQLSASEPEGWAVPGGSRRFRHVQRQQDRAYEGSSELDGQTVDRRVTVSPAQARKLLAAVRGLSGRGAHLEAFYACLYYAALRPSEAAMLRESGLYLPAKGWEGSSWSASASRAGTAWTDHGTARQEHGRKGTGQCRV